MFRTTALSGVWDVHRSFLLFSSFGVNARPLPSKYYCSTLAAQGGGALKNKARPEPAGVVLRHPSQVSAAPQQVWGGVSEVPQQ
jgi:hypothetical protein